MSPHERRQLKKKRGLLLKGDTFQSENHKNNHDLTNKSICPDLRINGETSVTKGVSVDRRISEKEDGHVSDSDEDRESQITVNGIIAPKCDQKLSLLGHGPHGKQVIEHILNEYGEDGIGQFCQRWRQVFVEAIHPRFLPVGWDVMHSGRQDFGDYSIFNTTKTATAVV